MSKRAEVVIGLVAVTALGFSVAALMIKASELKVLNDTFDLIQKVDTELVFAKIVDHLDDEGDSNLGDQ